MAAAVSLVTGDCNEVMAGMEPESVDAIVTDPPYGLEFMGKEWDRLQPDRSRPDATGKSVSPFYRPGWGNSKTDVSTRESQDWHTAWATAALRVAKPGAYLLAFGGTRTVHRLTVALEDAGWIIRDLLVWAYAQGFPKSRSSLKPAWEPIVLARKPGPLRELTIDACRIGTEVETWPATRSFAPGISSGYTEGREKGPTQSTGEAPNGRWPANVILTDPIFDGGWEGVVGGGSQSGGGNPARRNVGDDERTAYGSGWHQDATGLEPLDTSGTYSRFFLIRKASRSDREPLVPGGSTDYEHSGPRGHSLNGDGSPRPRPRPRPRFNQHPTVKPVDLMRHLVRLVTPQGGTVLDPFAGSGSTLIAAEREGFDWVGIEREPEYVAIAEQRLVHEQSGMGLSA